MKQKNTKDKPHTFQPIAVIGIGCRFPGGSHDPDSFWELLLKKRDAITEIPQDRWDVNKFYDPKPGVPGKYYTRFGGFIDNIHQFDPNFFGISPREAERMDPHQKLLLEVTWEAMEDAGIPVDRSKASNIGVFVGISNQDYQKIDFSLFEIDSTSIHTATGISFSIAANRISHNFNFSGPSIALDTACSSSLVTLHLAVQSIQNHECDMALAGGTNVILSPTTYVTFCNLSMLSPDGKCKAFDAHADGFVRGEGAGLVLLKPLEKAIRDQNKIYAVILGSGINQDARTPGITHPSQQAQEQLLKKVYQESGVEPGKVSYVEAHGTGTAAGDPIEARALGRVIGSRRPQNSPLMVGSVKTNIGHLESASGIAGFIKTALILRHRKIPANLHFNNPNPKIPFEKFHLKVPKKMIDWPETYPRYAAVNSFGFGGTNAHVLLTSAPDVSIRSQRKKKSVRTGDEVFCLSAPSQESLKTYAQECQNILFTEKWDPFTLHQICGALLKRKSRFPYRLSLVIDTKEKIYNGLTTFLRGESASGMTTAQTKHQAHKIAFIFSGQGPQWWGMGRELMEEEPLYKQVIEECHNILSKYSEWSLLDELNRDENESRMQLTSIAQPAIFALQAALFKLWESWGIKPDAVLGHSVGEVAAAYAGGILSLEDALYVIYHRGRCMEYAAPSSGRMLAVGLPPDKAGPYLKDFAGRVHLGAVNSPESVTFTGDAEPLEIIERQLLKDNVFCRFIKTKYAFHSHHMEGMKDELLNILKGIRTQPPKIPVYSTVTGRLANDNDFSGEYWWDNVRNQVKFAQAVEDLIRKKFTVFLELGPHPVLTSAVTESLLHFQHQASVFSSLRRDHRDRFNLLTTLSALHSQGVKVNWTKLYPEHYFEVDLPHSIYLREESWHQTELVKNFLMKSDHNSLLGFALSHYDQAWENQINPWTHPFLKDHCVHGHKLLPGTAYLESGFTLADQMEKQTYPILEQVSLLKTAFLPEKQNLWIRTVYNPEEKVFQIFCRDENETKKWNLHASGTILSSPSQKKKRIQLKTLLGKYKKILTKEKCYSLFKMTGMEYGPTFMGINRLYCGQGESLAEIMAPEEIKSELNYFQFHPALLDACLQAVIGTNVFDRSQSYLPVYFKSIKIFQKPGSHLWSHVKFAEGTGKKILADIEILDDKGYLLAEIDGLELQGIENQTKRISSSIDDMLYHYEWISQPQPQKQYKTQNDDDENQPGAWLIFFDGRGTDLELPEQFKNSGDECFSIYPGKFYERINIDRFRISQHIKADLSRILSSIHKENSNLKIRGIIDLSSMDIPPLNDLNPREYKQIMGTTSLKLLNLIQAIMEWKDRDLPRLWIVTRGAQSVRKKTESVSPFQSSVWGLGRVVVNEMPALRCTLIDFDPSGRKTINKSLEGKQLFTEILTDGIEDEVAFRGKNRYIHRLRKSRLTMDRNPLSLGNKENFRLETAQTGMLDSLLFRRIKRIDPGADEVEIKVKAAGLNFSDVMKGLNLYPGLPEGPVPLGIECAGVITRTGIKVKNWAPGDKVIALAPFSFSAYVIAPEYFLIPLPEKMNFKEAAALPLAYLTAHYALITKGRLIKGEKILIHSASGGVGLAAVQIARYIGAEIFATAGSSEKREYLRSFGIKHVMDSRSLNFASEIMEKTDGQGIDMVLNSLSGQAITKGLSLLRDYGRFLEIGKSDIYTNKKIGLYPFHKNLSFFSIDLDKIMREDPALIQLLLKEITLNISEGNYPPLPCKTYPYSKAKEAFRFMAAAKHIGKIVLFIDKDTIKVSPAAKSSVRLRPNASYLITGGFGGFGLLVADWLVSHGAKNLALMGRSGPQSPEAQRLIKRLKKKQVNIIEIQGDISRKQEVEKALARIRNSLPPLRGIFHLAMVLDDALLNNLTLKQMYDVLDPKILGAWHLHEYSKDLKLDCFVLFSSVSSLIGMPGQGNYVTANAFLDGLSFYRRSQKLPSITINWGFLGKTGIAARNKETAARFENQGLKSFSPEQAMEMMANFLEFNPIQMAVINMDWSRFGQMLQRYAVSPKFSDLWEVDEGETRDQSLGLNNKASFRKLLFTVPEKEKSELLLKALRDQMAKILGESSEKLDIEKPLSELGFDSLMAVELRNWAENNLGVRLPTIEIMKGPSIVQLSYKLIQIFTEQIKKFSSSGPKREKSMMLSKTIQRKSTENILTAIDELSDQEVEAMLHELLDNEKK